MFNPDIFSIITGISSLLGLLALIAYIYYLQQTRNVERSIKDVIEGEDLFNAKQIIDILSQFENDNQRLEAIKILTNYGTKKTVALLTKVKETVDIEKITIISTKHYLQISKISAMLFGGLALIGLIYTLASGNQNTDNSKSVTVSLNETNDSNKEISAIIKDFDTDDNKKRHNARILLARMFNSNKNKISDAFIKAIKDNNSYRVSLGVLVVLGDESTRKLANKDLMAEIITLKNSPNMEDKTFRDAYQSALSNQGY